MGVVHQVRDVERGEVVALKTMAHLDAGSLLRFKREFRALADISHPNVVQLYELFSEEDHWFFTMELVDGCDLLTWVHSSLSVPPTALVHSGRSIVRESRPSQGPRSGPSEHPTMLAPTETYDSLVDEVFSTPLFAESPPEVPVKARFLVRDAARLRDAFRQLASGVQAIHAAGKLHRDIKPLERDGDRRRACRATRFRGRRGVRAPATGRSARRRARPLPERRVPRRHSSVHGARASGVSAGDARVGLVRRRRHSLRGAHAANAVRRLDERPPALEAAAPGRSAVRPRRGNSTQSREAMHRPLAAGPTLTS